MEQRISKYGVVAGRILLKYLVYQVMFVVLGALSKIYPAVTISPLVLCELDMDASSRYLLQIAFIDSDFLHVYGLPRNLNLTPNIIWSLGVIKVTLGEM